ncbi:MAG: hypothetical protein WC552_01165 [Candidatus Omnitrophota bacterium]
MNKPWPDIISFAAKTFIVGFVFYLVASALFLNETKTIARLTEGLSVKVDHLDQQTGAVTGILRIFLAGENHPESLYFLALQDEILENPQAAVEKVSRAIQLSQIQVQKYQSKLRQLSNRK